MFEWELPKNLSDVEQPANYDISTERRCVLIGLAEKYIREFKKDGLAEKGTTTERNLTFNLLGLSIRNIVANEMIKEAINTGYIKKTDKKEIDFFRDRLMFYLSQEKIGQA